MAAITNGLDGVRRGRSVPSVRSGVLHAQRPLGVLAGCIRTDRRPEENGSRVDDDAVAGLRRIEAVETTRRGPGLLLADAAVLRTVARALEPLRCRTERNAAAEVHATLAERNEAELGHVLVDRGLVDLRRGRQRRGLLGVAHDVRPGLRRVEGLLLGIDCGEDVA